MIDNRLYEYMYNQLKAAPFRFVRYIYHEIDWSSRLIGLLGPRGIGKSTMVLQHIRNTMHEHQLYISADHLYFVDHKLEDLIDDFIKEGGTHLYIDEIHKYQGWSRVLKQVYDVYQNLYIVFTGSSILDIKKGVADLSRRALMYHMQGLSFREYLELFHEIKSKSYDIDSIVSNEVEIPGVAHPLPLFRDYLSRGYYPFAIESHFAQRLHQ